MKRRSLTTTAALVVLAATPIGLGLSGVASASAEPIAPATTTSAAQSFVVPSGSRPGATSIFFLGQYYTASPSEDISAYGISFRCDDGTTIPVRSTIYSPGSANRYGLPGAQFTGEIPISEVGHTCVIHGWAPTGRALTFPKPWNKPDELGQPRLMFDSTTVIRSSTGGLG